MKKQYFNKIIYSCLSQQGKRNIYFISWPEEKVIKQMKTKAKAIREVPEVIIFSFV